MTQYQIIFQATTEKLFPGAYETVRQSVEERLAEMERRLQENAPKGRAALADVARKLQWLAARRGQDISSTDEYNH